MVTLTLDHGAVIASEFASGAWLFELVHANGALVSLDVPLPGCNGKPVFNLQSHFLLKFI